MGPKGTVTSVELDRELAGQARNALLAAGADATVVVGDGRRGMPDGDQVDRIVVTASGDTVPRAWYDQLVPGGLLVVPFRLSVVMFALQAVVAFRKVASGFDAVAVTAGAFMTLRDPEGSRPRAAMVASEMADHGAHTGHRRPIEPPRPSPADTPTTATAAPSTRPGRPAAGRAVGPALAALGPADRQRLMVTALGFARTRPVDLGGAPSWSLGAYATLALPEERLVEVVGPRWPAAGEHILGVVDAVDGSLAVLAGSGGRRGSRPTAGRAPSARWPGSPTGGGPPVARASRTWRCGSATARAAPRLADPAPRRPLGGLRLGPA